MPRSFPIWGLAPPRNRENLRFPGLGPPAARWLTNWANKTKQNKITSKVIDPYFLFESSFYQLFCIVKDPGSRLPVYKAEMRWVNLRQPRWWTLKASIGQKTYRTLHSGWLALAPRLFPYFNVLSFRIGFPPPCQSQ